MNSSDSQYFSQDKETGFSAQDKDAGFSAQDRQKLLSVALRYSSVPVDIERSDIPSQTIIPKEVAAFLLALSNKGYVVEENLLRALGVKCSGAEDGGLEVLEEITLAINKALGVGLNWAPLVKGWDVPTGESYIDHLITFYANVLGKTAGMKGTTLPCGHFIPDGTFPLERYNGCPFCGTQFRTASFVYEGQGSKKKELRLMTILDLKELQRSLLSSNVPLDATQADSLKTLIEVFGVDENVEVSMKETRMIVADALFSSAEASKDAGMQEKIVKACSRFFESPQDILRFLWYRKTGRMQILEPKTLIKHSAKLNAHLWAVEDKTAEAASVMRNNLKLKYNRKMCGAVAYWMNNLAMEALQACEQMHPKRGMWVKMIHHLRLGEYSRRPGYEKLAVLLDEFYHGNYPVWKRELDKTLGDICGCIDYDRALQMLEQRPGTFARSLFAIMLRMGPDRALASFGKVLDKIPTRLVLSLGNAAALFFDTNALRIARPLTGSTKTIPYNRRLDNFTDAQRIKMAADVLNLYKEVLHNKFKKESGGVHRKIFIDRVLYDIPVSVGDRTSTIQDTSCALQGTRFMVEGDTIRLFMQWGKGLPAQHLDMDLAASICFKDGRQEYCAYYNLVATGAKHSGDIISIPNKVGAAEYVELNIPELQQAGARYVAFTCNAYSNGAISPNLMVGWMNSANPMTVSNATGVAYDPSTVQHIVRISEANLSKGLVFGVLDVQAKEITWLELPFTAQVGAKLNLKTVEALLSRLRNKLSVGELLSIKAQAQNSIVVDSLDQADADQRYTYNWALDASAVSKLL